MVDKIYINFNTIIEKMTTLINDNIDRELNKRIYSIWQSSYDTIKSSYNEKELSYDRNEFEQGYISLKRAFNIRVKQLNSVYGFSNMQYENRTKKDGILEILEYFGIIKKNILKKYLNNRNSIEHKDINNVSYEDALTEADYLWMFLKLTDIALERMLKYVSFEDAYLNNDFGTQVILQFNSVEKNEENYKLELNIYGNVLPSDITFLENDSYLEISDFKIINKEEYTSLTKEIFNEDVVNYYGLLFKGRINNDNIISNLLKEMITEDRIEIDGYKDIQRLFIK